MSKIKIEDIQQKLAENGWQLVSAEYKNLDDQLEFKCPEGHNVYGNWKRFRVRPECPVCNSNVYKIRDNKVIPKKKGNFRVLALDQATKVTGFAIYDNKKLVHYGVFSAIGNSEIERDNSIKNWLLSMINNWSPDFIGLEGIQFQTSVNGQSHSMGVTVFETLARLQGILMETCFERNIQFSVVSTNTWRATCGVKGRSRVDKKRSMQLLAKDWYDVTVSEDEADAIGIGYHFAQHGNLNSIETQSWE